MYVYIYILTNTVLFCLSFFEKINLSEFSDECKASNIISGWSLDDQHSQIATILFPNTWIHVAVSYEGWMLRLYLDGAIVSAAIGQRIGICFLSRAREKDSFSLVWFLPLKGI